MFVILSSESLQVKGDPHNGGLWQQAGNRKCWAKTKQTRKTAGSV